MVSAETTGQDRKSNVLINTISIVIPLVVAILLGIQNKVSLGEWTRSLPHAIGTINTLTTLSLVLGFVFIKLRRIQAHRWMMLLSFAFGGVFLVCYVLYHVSNPSNRFAGEGAVRYAYLFILISHIGLSLVVLPLVLRALYFGLTGQFDRHRRVARYAYPIWLYVSVTGVLVYLMVYQLFPAK